MKSLRLLNNKWIIGILLFILAVIVRIPSITQPLDNDSGAIAYHARLILQGEPLYGTHHPNHHLPAAYYTFALIFQLLGDRPESLKIVLIAWMWLTGWFIYLIGEHLSDQKTGFLAAILFIVSASMTNLAGDSAEIELWANLPLTFSFWLGIILLKKKKPPVAYIFVGMVSAVCFLYKAVYISSLAAVSLTLLFNALIENRREARLVFLKQSIAMLAGALLVLTPITYYFYSVGVLDGLLLVFTFGIRYSTHSDSALIFMMVLPLAMVAAPYFTLTIMGTASAGRILIFAKKAILLHQEKGITEVMLLIWFIASIIAAGYSRLPFPHYGQLILPPIVLLCANEISTLFHNLHNIPLYARNSIAIFLVLIIIGNILYSAKGYINGYIKYQSGQISYSEFLRYDVWLGNMNMDAVEIATYIQQRTVPNDKIFTWSNLMQIYYIANRPSSAYILWPDYISKLDKPESVLESDPIYIIYDPKMAIKSDWLFQNLAQSYQFETSINGFKIYRRLSTIVD